MKMCYLALPFALLFLSNYAVADIFYDNFDDNDISDWEPRCAYGNWGASSGMVYGSTASSPSVLVPEDGLHFFDCTIQTEVSGQHAFGIVCRLTTEDSGIIAYVSPDSDVARIRLIENGQLGATLASISVAFSSGVFYTLSFTCDNDQLSFHISVPSTDQSWEFSAIDPNPQPGACGLLMGNEPNAYWDWIEVEGTAAGSGEIAISGMTTDDQSLGDGDFAFEPGETIDLGLEVTSNASGPLTNSFGILQSMNSDLVVINNYVTYGTIDPGESQSGSSYFTVSAPSGTPVDEVYEMRLTLMADGGFQDLISFYLPVGNGLESDVESGAEEWTWEAVAAGWSNDWHVSSEKNYSTGGQYSFKCGHSGSGDYSNHHFGSLVTPLINLPLGSTINFWMWLDAQTQDLPEALDGGLIQYGRCGSWIDLTPVPYYSHQITSGSAGPFEDQTEVFSGTSPWTQYSITLPDSLAGPGQIRFVFGTDNYGTREGWYIDEIFMGIPTSTEDQDESDVFAEAQLSLSVNPFSSSLTFTYQLPGIENSSLEIFDVSGRLVVSIDVLSGAGLQTVTWNCTNSAGAVIPAGVYIARLYGHDQTTVRLIKI